jgi:hypothetical protein
MKESVRIGHTLTKETPPTVAERRREPPKALFRMINPLIKAILRSPMHGPVSKSLVVLTFQGRHTGKVYSMPVGYHKICDELIVFTNTHRPWYHNFEGGANVMLRLRGHDVPAYAEMVEDQDEMFETIMSLLDRFGKQNSHRLGITLPRGDELTTEVLHKASMGTVIIKLRLKADVRT